MAAPTATPVPMAVPDSTPTLEVAEGAVPAKPDLIKVYPEVSSKVVHTHHAGVWSGEDLLPEAIDQMLDASITALTGLNDAQEAWASLFRPNERIAIKVNAFRNSLIWTHVPLVKAVTDRLQRAGIPAEQIVVFDYYTSELETAGFEVNRDGPGVRCYGTDTDYTSGWEMVGTALKLSDVLLGCDALINMPVLKSHMLAGLSFALKNHYGTINRPDLFHRGAQIDRGIPELNALPPIHDRTRLIIGDVLNACLRYRNSFPYWEADYVGDSIMMSFDPVAHDAVGLEMLSNLITETGGDPKSANRMSERWLENGGEVGLGTYDLQHVVLVEVNL